MKSLFVYIVGLTLVTGCSTAPEEFHPAEDANISASSIEAKQLAAQIGADEVTEIEFVAESAELTTLSTRLLKQSLERAKARGPIERIAVVTWSDEEYPAKKSELSREQRKLAVARNYIIKEYLEKFDRKPVIRVYSMAERPGMIDRFITNSEWKIKKSLEHRATPNKEASFKNPPKSSHSIILFKNVSKKEKGN